MERKEALYYQSLSGHKVRCLMCNHFCVIDDAGVGNCKVRRNIQGALYSLNYGKIAALAIDPIEKKPLYHFFPGAKTLSIASQGCNFKCQFCQNHELSQVQNSAEIKGEDLKPEDIIKIAKAKNSNIISYTYTEPTIFYEFMLETAMLAKANNMQNVMVTNGFISEKPLADILQFIDAFNVDLKSFRVSIYEHIMGGKLEPILNNLHVIAKSKKWLEVTTLLIPEVNNSTEEMEDIASFISALGVHVPWHVSAFHPDYNMNGTDVKSTKFEDLKKAYAIGLQAGLKYVYIGNSTDTKGLITVCPTCNSDVIKRGQGYKIESSLEELKKLKGKCAKCGTIIDGVF